MNAFQVMDTYLPESMETVASELYRAAEFRKYLLSIKPASLEQKVVTVSHGVFGMMMTRTPEERDPNTRRAGKHQKNCGIMHVDAFLDQE